MRPMLHTLIPAATAIVHWFVLAAAGVAAPSTTVTFDVDDVSFSQIGNYDIANVSGCHLRGDPGLPLLPCRFVNLVIPRSCSPSRVRITADVKTRLPGEYLIAPAQPLPSAEDGFAPADSVGPDADVYQSTLPFPGDAATLDGVSMNWGWKVCTVVVWPLEYVPAKRELWLHQSIKISVDLAPSTEAEQGVLPRTPEQQEDWAKELEASVANPQDVWTFAPDSRSPVPVSRRWVLILPGHPEAQGRNGWIDALMPLVNHRQSQGLETETRYVKTITTASGETAVQAIRNYLIDQHSNHGARWACLVGDNEMIPWTYDGGNPNRPTDWCYCDLDGTWPYEADWAPELWVGRIPAITAQEASNFVSKVLAYEQNPGNGDTSYLTKAFYEYADGAQGLGTCDSVIVHQGYGVQDTLWRELPSYYDPLPYFPWDYDVVATLSNDHYNLVTVHAHGYTDCYWPISYCVGDSAISGSSFGLDDMAALSNTDYYFFWYSASCMHGKLDDTIYPRCLAEVATCMNPNGGAIAFAADTWTSRETPSAELQCHAWDVLFPKGPLVPRYCNHAGSVVALAKYRSAQAGESDDETRRGHVLFGDPATGIWTPQFMPGQPRPMVVGGEPHVGALRILSWGPNPVVGSRGSLLLSLDRRAELRVAAYDLMGRQVRQFHSGAATRGDRALSVDWSGLSQGTYVLRVIAGQEMLTREVTILR
ncbi:hypothetical protein JXA88_13100 [Candidatus Fermentibacteria bacterium]|nr:hypothetical protein [Candidatus Fermentibacteria bacterium]